MKAARFRLGAIESPQGDQERQLCWPSKVRESRSMSPFAPLFVTLEESRHQFAREPGGRIKPSCHVEASHPVSAADPAGCGVWVEASKDAQSSAGWSTGTSAVHVHEWLPTAFVSDKGRYRNYKAGVKMSDDASMQTGQILPVASDPIPAFRRHPARRPPRADDAGRHGVDAPHPPPPIPAGRMKATSANSWPMPASRPVPGSSLPASAPSTSPAGGTR